MTKILFICHGNICRSPMAEFVMKDMAEKQGCSEAFYIASAATSTEEIGNRVHPGTREILKRHGISCEGKYAGQLRTKDYDEYDYLIGMEQYNIANIMRIIKKDPDHKVSLLLDFTRSSGDIADPWYTGNFEATYKDVLLGCTGLLEYLIPKRD